MIDEEIRALEREDWRLAIRARARVGEPFECIFCGHALTGEAACGHREEWQVGRAFYVDWHGNFVPDEPRGIYVGAYVGNGEMVVRQPGARTQAILKLPEAWKPPACGCDHADVPEQRTMREYQEAHGVDARLAARLNPGRVIYHTEDRNRDGSPARWRVSGRTKLWKRGPKRFRTPLKHEMHDYGALEPHNCHMFRTEEEWALNAHERSKRG
jgi:hypothetical protein